MARKSSKTAHVMNLLAGDDTDSSKSEAARENLAASKTESTETIKELTVLAQQASIQTQEGPLTPSPISIIDMSSSVPDPVAELIRQQLEEDEKYEGSNSSSLADVSTEEQAAPLVPAEMLLEEQVSETAVSNDQVPKGQILPEQIPENQVPQELEPAASAENKESEAEPSFSMQEELPVSEMQSGEKTIPEQKNTPTYQYLNVMEYVVKNKVEEYMEKFDVCTCGHCIADTTALALTHLPPKYIVVEPPSASPLLNFYSNRFSQQIIVELTKACSIVKETPHH